MHKKLTQKMREKKSAEDLMCLADIVDMALDNMKEENPEFYEHLESLLYESVYGKVISEEMAQKIVEAMRPKAKWSCEETYYVLSKNGVNIPKWSGYVLMNMHYSDMKNILGGGEDDESLEKYIIATKDWYFDEDSPISGEEKLYNYFKYVVKKIG